MNILITGISGFIGSALFKNLPALVKGKMPVYGTSRSVETHHVFKADLSDDKDITDLVERCKAEKLMFSHIIHCAGILATPDNNRSIQLMKDNVKITENLILFALKSGIKNLIHLSTIGVYPNKDGTYDECSVTKPSSNAEGLYGLAKLISENLFDFYLLPSGINVTNLRLSQVYGEGMRTDRIMKIMEKEMLSDKKITVWGNGERVSNFVSIEEVLATILYFINSPTPGVFNVGGENLTYIELAEKVIEMNHKSGIDIVRLDRGVKSKVFINSDKLKNLRNSTQPSPKGGPIYS